METAFRIKELRRYLRLSQEDMAPIFRSDRSDTEWSGQETVSKWERGASVPREPLERAKDLLDFFEDPRSWLERRKVTEAEIAGCYIFPAYDPASPSLVFPTKVTHPRDIGNRRDSLSELAFETFSPSRLNREDWLVVLRRSLFTTSLTPKGRVNDLQMFYRENPEGTEAFMQSNSSHGPGALMHAIAKSSGYWNLHQVVEKKLTLSLKDFQKATETSDLIPALKRLSVGREIDFGSLSEREKDMYVRGIADGLTMSGYTFPDEQKDLRILLHYISTAIMVKETHRQTIMDLQELIRQSEKDRAKGGPTLELFLRGFKECLRRIGSLSEVSEEYMYRTHLSLLKAWADERVTR